MNLLSSSNSKPKRDTNTNLSCKRVACTKSTFSRQSNLLKKRDFKTSSSKTARTWNGSCTRLLCSFGGSKSRPSTPSQVTLVNKDEAKSSLPRPSVSVTASKSVDKNDSREVMTGSKQTNPSIVKKQVQNTAGPKDPSLRNLFSKLFINQTPKDPPPYNLRKRVEKSHAFKDSPAASMKRPKASSVATVKRETHKTKGPKASIVTIPKSESRKTETDGPKVSTAAPVKRPIPKPNNPKASQIGIQTREMKIVAPSTEIIHTAKNHPSSIQSRPWSDEPVHHIRWEGYDQEYEMSGQKCILCDMDLSVSPGGNDDEYLENNDYDDEYQYKPLLLPALDILSCGHVFHTKCSTSTDIFADEQSTDPGCVFCLSMA